MYGPRTGHLVYFLVADNCVKVGYTANLSPRINSIQVGNPRAVKLALTIGYESQDVALRAETYWRNQLLKCGTKASGEWVELEYDVIGSLLRDRNAIRYVSDEEYRTGHSNDEILEQTLGLYGLRARLSEAV